MNRPDGVAVHRKDLDVCHLWPGPERSRDCGKPVLADRADHGADVGDLHRLEGRGKDGDDIGRAHRKLHVAELKHGVAERDDAVAVYLGDRAGPGERDVPGCQGRRDGVTGPEDRGSPGSRGLAALGASSHRHDADSQGVELGGHQCGYPRGNAAEGEHPRLIGRKEPAPSPAESAPATEGVAEGADTRSATSAMSAAGVNPAYRIVSKRWSW